MPLSTSLPMNCQRLPNCTHLSFIQLSTTTCQSRILNLMQTVVRRRFNDWSTCAGMYNIVVQRSMTSATAALMTFGLVNDYPNSNLSSSPSGHGVLQGQADSRTGCLWPIRWRPTLAPRLNPCHWTEREWWRWILGTHGQIHINSHVTANTWEFRGATITELGAHAISAVWEFNIWVSLEWGAPLNTPSWTIRRWPLACWKRPSGAHSGQNPILEFCKAVQDFRSMPRRRWTLSWRTSRQHLCQARLQCSSTPTSHPASKGSSRSNTRKSRSVKGLRGRASTMNGSQHEEAFTAEDCCQIDADGCCSDFIAVNRLSGLLPGQLRWCLGSGFALLTVGLVRLVNNKDFDLDASTWSKGMTSIRRRLGTTWRSFAKEPNLGRFGSVCRAPSIANGLSSTMPLMRERSFWRDINGGSAVCCGIWMISSKILLKMIHFVKSILNGLILVEVGRKHLWSTWRSSWTKLAGSGLVVALMAATMGWRILLDSTSFVRNGSSKQMTSLFTRPSRRRTVGSHSHTWIQGQETSRSAYYPWRMVQSIARHWRQQLVSDRSLRLLTMKVDFKSSQWLASRLWRSRSCPRPLSLWSSITLWRPSS